MDKNRKLLLNPNSGLGRFLQIPQDFIDDGWMVRLKPMTTVIFLYIYRKIIGWHKTSDAISYSQIKKYTGAANDTIGDALKSLEEIGWIKRTYSAGYSTRIHLFLRNYLTQEEIQGITEVDETDYELDLVDDTSPETGEVSSVPLQFSSTTSPEILYPPLQFSSIQYTKGKIQKENTLIGQQKSEVFSSSEELPIQSSPVRVVPEFTVKSLSEEAVEDVPKEVFTTSVLTDKVKKFWEKVNLKIANGDPLGTNELLAVFSDLYRSKHNGLRYAVQPKHRSKIKTLLESLPSQDVLHAVKYYSDNESSYPGGVMSVDVFVGWINDILGKMNNVTSKTSLESRRDVDRKGGIGEWK